MSLPTPEEMRDRSKTNAQMREMMAQMAENVESKENSAAKAQAVASLATSGGVITYDKTAFTLATSNSQYSKTPIIQTQGMSKLYIRLQSRSGAEVVAGYNKTTNAREILVPARLSNQRDVSQFIDIPSHIDRIEIIAANETYTEYNSAYEPMFILGNDFGLMQTKINSLKKVIFQNGELPAESFATYSELSASNSTLTYALVTNDSDPAKNGYYFKVNNEWKKKSKSLVAEINDLNDAVKPKVITYDKTAFTLATSNSQYSKTPIIQTQGMSKLYIRLQSRSGAEVVAGYNKTTNAREILVPARLSNQRDVSQFVDIPSHIDRIEIIAANETYTEYNSAYEPMSILGSSEVNINAELKNPKTLLHKGAQIPADTVNTYAELEAVPYAEGSYRYVESDPDANKNGYYYRLSNEWVFSKDGVKDNLAEFFNKLRNKAVLCDKSAFTVSTSKPEYKATPRIMTNGAKKLYIQGQSRSGAEVVLGYPLGGKAADKVVIIPARLSNQRDIRMTVDIPVGVEEIQVYLANELYTEYNKDFEPFFILSKTEEGIQNKLNEMQNSGQVSSLRAKGDIYNVSSMYPSLSLKATRDLTFKDGTERTTLQYLWHDSENKFYISSSIHGAKQFIFKYELSDFYGLEPHMFSMGFDKYGNILCVYRTEYDDASLYTDETRKNPILLIKTDNYKPFVIDFGTSLKPSSWLQNCGFLCTEDAIFITEYTRPSVRTANTWKATYPLTVVANWKTVQSFELDPDIYTSATLKHIHNVDRDPYTGFIYTSTGDANPGAAIYVSQDNGETFTAAVSGSEKYCRVLNWVFTEDYIYWATDSTQEKHFFFKAPRAANGVLDVANIVDVVQFPMDSQATYATIYLPKINALVFLGRNDRNTADPAHIEIWDLVNNQFVRAKTIHPVGRAALACGFRCEAFEYVPRGNEIVCGFSKASSYLNNNGLLGNGTATANKVNSIVITVDRIGADFTVSFDTVV
ncbi:hypothetical protein KTJ53_00810 [Acinetobacter variabilis]|uniref:hypothetical protein n=1 Tax=Acinetobacter variabilis TaxID=70346 RepID=UPI0021D3641B|nr:hypothetical protein [Acinetobacter variabilis]MCU4628257.1 hypothetical protein [Acinetobacter variabilis]